MTTQSWSSTFDHSSDAGFRAWGLEMNTKLAAVGLIQTSDTGQINWATVTRPGSSTLAGFEIWRFNDTLQSTAPIYIRIDYGTNSGLTTPRMAISVGTGTNGSGTLTGAALTTARSATANAAPASTVTAYQSYMCATEGVFWFSWKVSGISAGIASGGFYIGRSCDASGAPTALGAHIVWGSGSSVSYTGWQNLRFAATASSGTFQGSIGSVQTIPIGKLTSSLTAGGNNQAYLWWMAFPDVCPHFAMATVLASEVGSGTTISMALVGSTTRTFIRPGSLWGADPDGSAVYSPVLLWE